MRREGIIIGARHPRKITANERQRQKSRPYRRRHVRQQFLGRLQMPARLTDQLIDCRAGVRGLSAGKHVLNVTSMALQELQRQKQLPARRIARQRGDHLTEAESETRMTRQVVDLRRRRLKYPGSRRKKRR